MSDPVDVLSVVHPVPMRYLPRRGRSERIALGRATTPVRLTRTTPSEIGTAFPGTLPGGASVIFVRIEGSIFSKATAPDGPENRAPDFAGYLRAEGFGTHTTQMQRAFVGTPVSARLGATDGSGKEWPVAKTDYRGQEGLAGEAREISFDGTDAARRDLQAFFDRSVRVVGRTVYVDTGGPLFTPTRDRWRQLSYKPNLYPRMLSSPADDLVGPFTRDEVFEAERRRIEALSALVGGDVPMAEDKILGVPQKSSLGRGVTTDTDLLFANKAPGDLLDALAPAIRAGSRGVMGEPSTREGIDRLSWMALRGSIGTIDPTEALEVVRHLAEVAMWGMTMPQVAKARSEDLAMLRRHCLEWVLPRMLGATATIGEDDALALASLGF